MDWRVSTAEITEQVRFAQPQPNPKSTKSAQQSLPRIRIFFGFPHVCVDSAVLEATRRIICSDISTTDSAPKNRAK
jgi:hypothetical protein